MRVHVLACERKLDGEKKEGELMKKNGKFPKLYPNCAFPYFIHSFLVFH